MLPRSPGDCAGDRVLGVKLGVRILAFVLGMLLVRRLGVSSMFFAMLAFVLDLGLELDRRGLDRATGVARQHEQGERIAQGGFGFFDRRFVLVGLGGVLEPDDVHPGRHQLHLDAIAFDRDVQNRVAVLMGAELASLGFVRQGDADRKQRQRADHHRFHLDCL